MPARQAAHALIALRCCSALCVALRGTAQTGFDRPGGDYSNFAVRSGDPAACAARCERDGRCRAWSFSYPRTAAHERDVLAEEPA